VTSGFEGEVHRKIGATLAKFNLVFDGVFDGVDEGAVISQSAISGD